MLTGASSFLFEYCPLKLEMDAAGVCTANKQALQIYFSKSKPHRFLVFLFFSGQPFQIPQKSPEFSMKTTFFYSRKHAYELFAIVVLLFFVINNTKLPTNLQQIIT